MDGWVYVDAWTNPEPGNVCDPVCGPLLTSHTVLTLASNGKGSHLVSDFQPQRFKIVNSSFKPRDGWDAKETNRVKWSLSLSLTHLSHKLFQISLLTSDPRLINALWAHGPMPSLDVGFVFLGVTSPRRALPYTMQSIRVQWRWVTLEGPHGLYPSLEQLPLMKSQSVPKLLA